MKQKLSKQWSSNFFFWPLEQNKLVKIVIKKLQVNKWAVNPQDFLEAGH